MRPFAHRAGGSTRERGGPGAHAPVRPPGGRLDAGTRRAGRPCAGSPTGWAARHGNAAGRALMRRFAHRVGGLSGPEVRDRIDVDQRRSVRVRDRPAVERDDDRRHVVQHRAEPAFARADEFLDRRDPVFASDGHRQRSRPPSRSSRQARSTPSERGKERRRTAGSSDGMSPPTTTTRSTGPGQCRQAVPRPTSGPSNARRVVHASGRPRQRAIVAGREDDDDVIGDGAHGGDGAIQQRARRRSARRACRARSGATRRPPGRCRRSCIAARSWPAAGAFGPGTWPAGVRRRIARRSRSSRMAMTYLRLVPVASRQARRGQRLAAASRRAIAASSRYVDIA